jgi:hypothetical protein
MAIRIAHFGTPVLRAHVFLDGIVFTGLGFYKPQNVGNTCGPILPMMADIYNVGGGASTDIIQQLHHHPAGGSIKALTGFIQDQQQG